MSGETDRKKRSTDEYGRPLTLTEKIKNVCIAIGALSALILGIIANSRGEPVAEKTWATLRTEVNKQADAINRVHARLVYLQAHEDGRHAAEIQLRLDDLQKRYDALKAQTPTRAISVKGSATSLPPGTCREGHIDVGGKCQKVAPAVAKTVAAGRSAADLAQKRLLEEKRRGEALRRKLDVVKQTQQKFPELRPLPKKLDDAAE